jgi:hypothetical protein
MGSEKKVESIGDVQLTGAMVLRCTLDQFNEIKTYVEKYARARLIYQKISLNKLRICAEEAAPNGQE